MVEQQELRPDHVFNTDHWKRRCVRLERKRGMGVIKKTHLHESNSHAPYINPLNNVGTPSEKYKYFRQLLQIKRHNKFQSRTFCVPYMQYHHKTSLQSHSESHGGQKQKLHGLKMDFSRFCVMLSTGHPHGNDIPYKRNPF